jgi:uncharacterized protein
MSLRHAVKRTVTSGRQYQQLRLQSTQTKTASSVVSDLFSSLRWKAASVLTSSLSEAEKKELFKKLQISDPGVTALDTTTASDESTTEPYLVEHSIAEAVAKARTEEAQKQQDKWEKEREQLTLQAQQAAQARIEQELAIHKQRTKRFEEWTQELSEAKNENNTVNAHVVDDHHPVLGPVISDFGYKRVHSVPAKALSSIAVWKKQRTFRSDRAKSMAKDKLKTLHLGFPGVIVLHEVSRYRYFFMLAFTKCVSPHFVCYPTRHRSGPRRQPKDCRRAASRWYDDSHARTNRRSLGCGFGKHFGRSVPTTASPRRQSCRANLR